ncbi:MAG: hypothetical protein JWM93_3969 [Frankiales bacterium]|nr:hypothetical protein [Frankiales bacterium]
MLAEFDEIDLNGFHEIDLNEPGALEALLAFHSRAFGAARMEGDDDDGDGDEDGDDGKPAAKKAAAKKAVAKKAAAKKAAAKGSGDDDDGDGDEDEDEAEKQQKALRTERSKVSAAAGLIAKLTGRSKSEVSRALRKGGDAVTALETNDDGDEDDDTPPAKKTAAKKTSGSKSEAEIRREVEAQHEAKLVRSAVRALAAETFLNPIDALPNLHLDDYEVDEEGELVDPETVSSDLAAVLKKFPHYAKKKGPKSDRSQGNRGNGSGERPKNMRDLSRMTVE